MRISLRISIIFASFAFFTLQVNAANKPLVVKGYGVNENDALNNAKKSAIGSFCGETILGSTRSLTETQKTTKIVNGSSPSKSFNSDLKSTDDSIALVGGKVKSFKVINKGQDNLGSFVEIEAVVTDCKKGDLVQGAMTNQQIITELKTVNNELKRLGNNDLIAHPQTLAQKYHNARILSQRGEIDRAIKAYEQVLNEPVVFADPIQDLVKLTRRVYGTDGSIKYLKKSLAHLNGRPEYFYAIQYVEVDRPISGGWDVARKSVDDFPPFANLYLTSLNNSCFELPSGKINECVSGISNLKDVEVVVRKLQTKMKNGEYSNYFIDTNRAESEVAIKLNTISTIKKSDDLQKKLDAIDKKFQR